MLLEYGFKKLSTYITLTLTAAILLLTFGNPLYFDRIIVFVLLVTAALSFKLDKNIFSIACIILFERVFEETIWAIMNHELWDYDLIYAQFALLCVVLICALNRQQLLSKLVVLFVLICEAAYLYWYSIGYVVPRLGFAFTILLETLISINLLSRRVQIWHKYIAPDKSVMRKGIDKSMLLIMHLFILLEVLRISEYLLRHIFGMHQIIVIFNNYAYMAHCLTAFILWIMFIESWRLIKQARFAA